MKRARWIILAALAAAGGLVALVVASGFVVGGGALVALTATAAAATCQATPDVAGVVPVGKLDADQSRNAATIIAVGRGMQIPERGWVIAVAVAMQESGLRNVDHGDDWYWGGAGHSPSRGLFQQIPAYYPGVDVMDPGQAARAFYLRLVAPTDYRGRPRAPWENRPLPQVAQEVQGSAFPAEYAKHEGVAQQAVRDLAGVTVVASVCQQVATVEGWALPLPPGKVHAPVAEHHDYPAVDLPLSPGETQTVFAMTAGTATPMDEPGGCGHGVYVRGATGEWLYCHLSQQLVTVGQQVRPHDQIGISGWSGGVSPPGPGGAHLHVQLKRAGRLTCPQPILDALVAGQAPPPVEVLPQPAGNTCLGAWANR